MVSEEVTRHSPRYIRLVQKKSKPGSATLLPLLSLTRFFIAFIFAGSSKLTKFSEFEKFTHQHSLIKNEANARIVSAFFFTLFYLGFQMFVFGFHEIASEALSSDCIAFLY